MPTGYPPFAALRDDGTVEVRRGVWDEPARSWPPDVPPTIMCASLDPDEPISPLVRTPRTTAWWHTYMAGKPDCWQARLLASDRRAAAAPPCRTIDAPLRAAPLVPSRGCGPAPPRMTLDPSGRAIGGVRL
jgi:hypothetical protein